ncbi:MAG: glutamate synthase subunit alpha, partial [Anderseniella sp.]|nr:glutamate synthase subunit alpha [Anderseniella sp.]
MTYEVSARSKALTQAGLPAKTGLYDPANEHDACGVGMIANINNDKSHRVIADGLRILANLEHRGAVGADPKAGDGAGILLQIPHDFFVTEAKRLGFKLPGAGDYGVGFVFLPRDPAVRERIEQIFAKAALEEDLEVAGWRDVPVNKEVLGTSVLPTEPFHRQVFVTRGPGFKDTDPLAFARKLFVMRKVVSNRVTSITDTDCSGYYVVSMSPDTIIYKGLVLGVNLGDYYNDLKNPEVTSALALVHQRFSTNTFPSWPLAHPYRMICHNGEINTLRGNYNWMAARYATMSSDLFGADMEKLWPISYEGQSDSACFDNALELLQFAGYPMSHAMMMLIPEAWAGNPLMDENRRSFYEYHAALMEPWDGPAAIAFTNGRQIGATLDRNGLRPARYLVSSDGFVMLASEMGVLD